MLAEDEHIRFRWTHALHQPQHGLHGRRFGDQLGEPFFPEGAVLDLEMLALAQRATQLHLGAHGREQTPVVPRLLDVIARAAPHRRDRAVDAAPRRHHHHRRRALLPLDARQQIQPLGTGRCIARIVHVHEQRIEVAGFDGGENRARRGCGLDFEALSFQEQFEGFQDVSLIVSYEETRCASEHAVQV